MVVGVGVYMGANNLRYVLSMSCAVSDVILFWIAIYQESVVLKLYKQHIYCHFESLIFPNNNTWTCYL